MSAIATLCWASLTGLGAEDAGDPPESSATDKREQRGAEYRDNPDWREAEIDAERDRKAQLAREQAGTSQQPLQAGYVPGYRERPGLGLSLLAPAQPSVLPGGITPPPGAPAHSGDFRFAFRGYLQAGLRAGIGERTGAYEGQKTRPLHGDPLVPGAAFGWFDRTGTVPVPWAQLIFSVGNDVVEATAMIAAWSLGQADESARYFQPPSKLWFSDAFLTYTPPVAPVGLRINAGVFTERYGAMGEYDTGSYGTPVIGVIHGTGLASTVMLPFDNDVTVSIEGGFKGDFNRVPVGIVPDQSNEHARPIEGSTYAAHGHLAFDFHQVGQLTGHTIHAFSRDDRGDELEGRDIYPDDVRRKDGSLTILGADLRLRLRHFGYLYLGGSHVIGRDTITVSNLVQVLDNAPGRDMAERYWSFASAGNGTLTLAGGQYRLSVGTLLRHPERFFGDAPDLIVTVFGLYGRQTNTAAHNPKSDMLKFGTEATYSVLPRLAFAGRIDAVMPHLADRSRSFAVLSPKLIFRNDWNTRATLTLQYSAYVLGQGTRVEGDDRLLNNPSGQPDAHLLALYGTMWW